MLKHLNRIFLNKKWVILILCTALGNIFYAHGSPGFAIEPSDVVTVAGRSVTLHCVAEVPDDYVGDDVSIRWRGEDPSSYFNVRDPKRTLLSNGSLHIPHITLEDQGNYQCVATFDGIDSMASRFAKVQVAGLPSLANQPQDLRVFPGQTAHFSCMMNGPLKYSITWIKDERPLVIDSSKMVLMPSGSLEIDKVDSTDQGSYKCNASSSGMYKVSNKAVLTMDMDEEAASNVMAPVFITEPRSMVVKEGETIMLDCAANGYPRPWLIWLKHGVTLDIADYGSRFRKLGTGSLQILNIEEKDAGSYQCRAENGEDSIDATANIVVQVPPQFVRMPQDVEAYEKDDIELMCQVTGKPEPRIQWLKNGEPITTNDYLRLVNGYNLKILGLMQMDAGIFQCVATNAAGNIQAAARLTVLKSRPTKSNGKKASDSDRRLPFPLKSDDDDEDEDNLDSDYEDYDDEEDEDEDEEDKNDNNDESDLIPTFLNVSHPKLSKESKSHPNKAPPKFFSPNTLDPSELDKEEPYSEYLPSKPRDVQARFVSKTNVTLSWKPPLHPNGEIKSYSIFFRQEGSQRERVLNVSGTVTEDQTVPELQPDRLYHFRVVANNINGPGHSSDDLKIATEAEIYVPGPPLAVNAFASSPTSIYVQWKPPTVANGEDLQYYLYYMEGDSMDERSIKTSELFYELIGLKKFTEYSIWVVAFNDKGPGSPSEDVVVRTLSDVPSESPKNVVVEADGATSVVVRWEPPPKDGQNGIITGYKLRYKKQNRRNRGERGNTVTAAGDHRLHVLSDLDKGSTYQIRLWAMNINGTGPPTDWYSVETYANDLDESHVPDQPTNLIARPSASSIRVSWSPPKNSNILVRGYTIRWGKGAPYDYTQILEGKQRTYNIDNLELNSEYVISLSAYNKIGAGQAVYVSVRTREEPPPESQAPLMPPVGLKTIVLSSSTVVLHWTDTLRTSQVIDDRYYSVRYAGAHHPNSRPKYYNTTDLSCMITDLKPNTQYEFSVKLIKGRRESKWSMIVFNTTQEDIPSSAPRDLTIVPVEKNPTQVNLNWQPPKQANGLITGYVILYTTDPEKSEKDWIPQNIVGDKMTAVIKGLKPSTTYSFKIQARNNKGHGPLSPRVSFTTAEGSGLASDTNLFGKDGRPLSKMIYIILACSLIAVFCVTLIIGIICCKRASARHRNTSGYMKGNLKPNTNMKPPDLWIHHDQMELKALEKSHHSNSDIGPSSSGSQMNTLGRTSSQQNEFDHTSSLDKRTYLPSYVGSNAEKTSTIKRTVKPKPISLPLDSQPIAQPVMTTSTNITQSPGSELGRPLYPRTQYRAHITLDSSGNAIENPYSFQSAYDSIGNVAPSVIISASGTYSNATSGAAISQSAPSAATSQTSTGQQPSAGSGGDNNGTLGKRQQGHPLKSFSVPAPPPQSAPGTPQQKHVVRPIQGSSPYKKPGPHGIIGTGSPSNTKLRTGPGTAEEVARLQPSYSTEELNQEMANLEGLMKDLNAITASEFEC